MKSCGLRRVQSLSDCRWSPVLCFRFAVVAAAIVGLSGCMSSTPSGFPKPQSPPTPSAQPAMPSPQSSSGGSQGSPSGSPSGQQGGQQSPFPSPGSGSPLPRPPTVGIPNPLPNPTVGLPSVPTLPSGQDGPIDPTMPGMPSDGQSGEGSEDGEEGSDAGSDASADGNLETGGEFPEGDPEDVQSSQQEEGGDSASFPGSLLPGTEESGGDSDWEVSNQLPYPGGALPGVEKQDGVSDLPGEFEQGGDGSGVDGELQKALQTMDGEIMDERIEGKSRANDQAAASAGLLDDPEMEGGTLDEANGSGEGADTNDSGDLADENAGDGRPNLPQTVRAVPDDPDARDEDIIARQLREAAMAETDPELKEELWEELRKYEGGNK